MKIRLVVRQQVTIDVHEAFKYYRNISPQLATRFRQNVRSAIQVIKQVPFGSDIVFDEVRRFNLSPFPYTIFYVVVERARELEIVLLFVSHQHSNPKNWKSEADRLK